MGDVDFSRFVYMNMKLIIKLWTFRTSPSTENINEDFGIRLILILTLSEKQERKCSMISLHN